jgi:myo-inositol-1(or 4)-monophosphatase
VLIPFLLQMAASHLLRERLESYMNTTTVEANADDVLLLSQVVELARQAGDRVAAVFSAAARPNGLDDLFAAAEWLGQLSMEGLRVALSTLRPNAQWLEDDPEEHAVSQDLTGEWWVVDGVEGAVNFLHGLSEWAVNITLVRDNLPVVAVVYQPTGELTYTAVRGGGSQLNGKPLRTSGKTELSVAIATTSMGGGSAEQNRRTADVIEVMFERALFVRQTIPSTFPLLGVAAGNFDVYWRFGLDLPALAPGVLLVTEAGGVATDLLGQPWQADSSDVVVAAPGLYDEFFGALSVISSGNL